MIVREVRDVVRAAGGTVADADALLEGGIGCTGMPAVALTGCARRPLGLGAPASVAASPMGTAGASGAGAGSGAGRDREPNSVH